MFNYIFKVFFSMSICFNFYVTATTLDELKQKYVNLILECTKEFPITSADVEVLKNRRMPDNQSVKCLFACAYKRAGMMDEQGMLSVEGLRKISQKYLSDNPVLMKKAEEFTDACKSVNDVGVGDGNAGCDRAALIFKCSIEKAPQFDFAV